MFPPRYSSFPFVEIRLSNFMGHKILLLEKQKKGRFLKWNVWILSWDKMRKQKLNAWWRTKTEMDYPKLLHQGILFRNYFSKTNHLWKCIKFDHKGDFKTYDIIFQYV